MDDDLMLADWSELPGYLHGLILNKLKTTLSLLDYIRFGAVCFEWRSRSIQNYEHIKLPNNLPVLMIPSPLTEEEMEKKQYDDEDDNDGQQEHGQTMYYYNPKVIWKGQDQTRHKSTRSFYSLSQGKIYQDFQLAVPYYKNCRGSSHGWLITVDEEEQLDGTYSYPVRLFNPFRSTNNEIQLPPLTPILNMDGREGYNEEPNCSFYLLKAYLSANPSSLPNLANLIVFGVFGSNRFIFCRPGDIAWTYLSVERQFRPIKDLICYKGRVRAIIQNGSVLDLDFAHHLSQPNVTFVERPPVNGNFLSRKYLVESGGDLLQVQRDNYNDEQSTIGFRVFKLNDDDKWVEMDSLDGHILFLGDNSSISISATDFPDLIPNCIYFTDDNCETYDYDQRFGPRDNGVFNFEDRSILFNDGDGHIMPPPIWIQPML